MLLSTALGCASSYGVARARVVTDPSFQFFRARVQDTGPPRPLRNLSMSSITMGACTSGLTFLTLGVFRAV